MTVYIIVHHTYYDSSEIHSVSATRSGAVASVPANWQRSASCDELWHDRQDTMVLEEHEVLP